MRMTSGVHQNLTQLEWLKPTFRICLLAKSNKLGIGIGFGGQGGDPRYESYTPPALHTR